MRCNLRNTQANANYASWPASTHKCGKPTRKTAAEAALRRCLGLCLRLRLFLGLRCFLWRLLALRSCWWSFFLHALGRRSSSLGTTQQLVAVLASQDLHTPAAFWEGKLHSNRNPNPGNTNTTGINLGWTRYTTFNTLFIVQIQLGLIWVRLVRQHSTPFKLWAPINPINNSHSYCVTSVCRGAMDRAPCLFSVFCTQFEVLRSNRFQRKHECWDIRAFGYTRAQEIKPQLPAPALMWRIKLDLTFKVQKKHSDQNTASAKPKDNATKTTRTKHCKHQAKKQSDQNNANKTLQAPSQKTKQPKQREQNTASAKPKTQRDQNNENKTSQAPSQKTKRPKQREQNIASSKAKQQTSHGL